jgi:serine/threonine protein phosphatase 1
MRQFCISDIHGCSTSFRSLLNRIELTKDDQLFLLGDYINRGPDSKGVLDIIMNLQRENYEVFVLRGNHEQMLIDAITDLRVEMLLMQNGGSETLTSFGADRAGDVPPAYTGFIRESLLYMELDQFLLVHAGFNFKRKDFLNDTEAMLWIRDFSAGRRKLRGRTVVHGHNPWPRDRIEAQFRGRRPPTIINIDAGCVYKREGSALCALELSEMKVTFVANSD